MVTTLLFRVMLSIGLLFPGLPAWRHAHGGGNRPHDHRDHGHPADHDHRGAGESHAHVHFSLLGVGFTLPMESDDDDSPRGGFTRLVAAPLVLDADFAFQIVSLAQPILDIGEPLPTAPGFRCIVVDTAPLCDSARRDRTGVLLI